MNEWMDKDQSPGYHFWQCDEMQKLQFMHILQIPFHIYW